MFSEAGDSSKIVDVPVLAMPLNVLIFASMAFYQKDEIAISCVVSGVSCLILYSGFLYYGMSASAVLNFKLHRSEYVRRAMDSPKISLLIAMLSEETSGPGGTSVFYEIVYDPNKEMIRRRSDELTQCEYKFEELESDFFYVVRSC